MAKIVTIDGTAASPLGLAAYPDQSRDCVRRALVSGINFFFFYDLSQKLFVQGLKDVVQDRRNEVILASGSGARTASGLRAVRRRILSEIGAETIDIFFAEYINPADDIMAVFGRDGVLDELRKWKSDGSIRYVGASAHDRKLAKRLAEDARVDVLMHRFNMAHRKAELDVFPMALKTQTPVIAFTATRWGSLLQPQPQFDCRPPTAAECYQYCLAQPAVHVVLTAPKTVAELDENLQVEKMPPMNDSTLGIWNRFGDFVYNVGGAQSHNFETQWP